MFENLPHRTQAMNDHLQSERLENSKTAMKNRFWRREAAMLKKFVEVYCRNQHQTKKILCPSCNDLLNYSIQRLYSCPYDPKPPCKQCPTHCYQPKMREKIREIMRTSGMYFVRRGRLDWLVKYFLINRSIDRSKLKIRTRSGKKTVL